MVDTLPALEIHSGVEATPTPESAREHLITTVENVRADMRASGVEIAQRLNAGQTISDVERQQLIDTEILNAGIQAMTGIEDKLSSDSPLTYPLEIPIEGADRIEKWEESLPLDGAIRFREREIEILQRMQRRYTPDSEAHKQFQERIQAYQQEMNVLMFSSKPYAELHPQIMEDDNEVAINRIRVEAKRNSDRVVNGEMLSDRGPIQNWVDAQKYLREARRDLVVPDERKGLETASFTTISENGQMDAAPVPQAEITNAAQEMKNLLGDTGVPAAEENGVDDKGTLSPTIGSTNIPFSLGGSSPTKSHTAGAPPVEPAMKPSESLAEEGASTHMPLGEAGAVTSETATETGSPPSPLVVDPLESHPTSVVEPVVSLLRRPESVTNPIEPIDPLSSSTTPVRKGILERLFGGGKAANAARTAAATGTIAARVTGSSILPDFDTLKSNTDKVSQLLQKPAIAQQSEMPTQANPGFVPEPGLMGPVGGNPNRLVTDSTFSMPTGDSEQPTSPTDKSTTPGLGVLPTPQPELGGPEPKLPNPPEPPTPPEPPVPPAEPQIYTIKEGETLNKIVTEDLKKILGDKEVDELTMDKYRRAAIYYIAETARRDGQVIQNPDLINPGLKIDRSNKVYGLVMKAVERDSSNPVISTAISPQQIGEYMAKTWDWINKSQLEPTS